MSVVGTLSADTSRFVDRVLVSRKSNSGKSSMTNNHNNGSVGVATSSTASSYTTTSSSPPQTGNSATSLHVSSHTLDKVKVAKITLEHYYHNLVQQYRERQNRYKILESMMESEGLTEEQITIEQIVTYH
ncbi:unnamed protein product [Echinostoma caproni]|uniref:EB1 C-terminal domain-containing protein n=1 Tax=Echinostoma caproni TaxID=27848 RepID=A0A183B033_9TREM|nr:unnamed protein product [Echinostoma caproni]